MKFSEFFVRNASFTLIIFLMVMMLGISSLLNMPRGEDPPFDAPIFVVLAIFPGTSPADIEELVADPIEDVIYELDDIKKIETACDDGVMLMQIEFNYGVDREVKNNDITREVNKLLPELPDDIYQLEIIKAASSDVAILQSALISETASYAELEKKAEELKTRLEKLSDLKRVEIQAFPSQEVQVKIDLEKMAQNRLALNQVLGAIQANNINIPGGSIDIGPKRFNIKTASDFHSLEDIRRTVVHTSPEGRIVNLSDIADVRYGEEDASHLARYNGRRAVWVVTMMKDRKNIVQVREKVEPVLASFKETLPAGMELEISFDQAESVQRRLGGLARDFGIAVLLVLLTLLPLGPRASLVVMISIPLSLAIGLAILDLLDYTLNQLSIVGMVVALGLLVDDSIVIVENIERFLRMGYSKREAAIAATKQIGVAVVGCTATLVLAFLPLAFLPEGSGQFIRSLPMAVIMTVLASLFVALTIIPFLSSHMLKPHERPEGNIFLRAFNRYLNKPYHGVLEWAFKHPVLTLAGAALIFAGSLALIPKIGFSLFPMSEKPMMMVNIETPLGMNLDETDQIARYVESDLLSRPEVASVSANIGKGNPRVYYNEFQREASPNYAQLFILLDPGMHMPEITAFSDTLRARFAAYPGAEIRVVNFQQGPPVVAPIEIRILGQNLDTLRALSLKVENMMENTEGTLYVNNRLRRTKTDMEVVIDRDKAGMLGILPAEIARTVRLGLAGLEAGTFRTEEGEEYKVNVSLYENKEEALQLFSRIYVSSLSGALVPLSQVATLELKNSPSLIRHFNKERYTNVNSFVKTGYNTDLLTDEILEKLETIDLPEGYSFVAAGERESREESFAGMGTIIIIAFFGLLAILILEFRTFKSTLIVLSVVPLGIIGALVVLFLIGETLSFVATVGMIALVGIEIKNSILLVDYTNQLRAQGMPLRQAIIEGAETRFLPILLTSMTAIGGLTPLVLENSPLISPLAWVLIGGLISSTFLSRIVTPLLYFLLPPKL
jgi:multidrug efflux pump subunit AcrB